MNIKVFDRVKQASSTNGTGSLTFVSSFSSFQDFSGVFQNGDRTYYTIEAGSKFEVGIGTYSGNTLSRDIILDSTSGIGNHIHVTGSSVVFVTYPASGGIFLSSGIQNSVPYFISNRSLHSDTGFVYLNNKLGLGTTNPQYQVHVVGTGDFDTIRFDDGTLQTTAWTGVDLSAYATTSYVTGISGSLQTQITNNIYDYWKIGVTGITDNIINNDTLNFTGLGTISLTYDINNNILGISGLATDVSSFATTTYVNTVSGNLQSQINNLDNYQYWTISVTGTSDNISSTQSLSLTGLGSISLSYNPTSNLLSIVGTEYTSTGYITGVSGSLQNQINTLSGAVYNGWTLRGDSATTTVVNNGETVQFTGAGAVTISLGGSDNRIVTISGSQQDLSSYATITYLDTASGTLQSQIDAKDNYQYWRVGVTGLTDNITSTQTVTFTGGGLTSVEYDASTNTMTISSVGDGAGAGAYVWNIAVGNEASTVISSGETVSFTGLGTVQITRSSNEIRISGIATDLSSYATTSYIDSVSGNLQSQISSNDTDISNLSGLVYQGWNINITGTSDLITSAQTVTFTGAGLTSLTYDQSTNTITVSSIGDGAGAGAYDWNLGVGNEATTVISSGESVTFTGQGNIAVTRSSNQITISGTDTNTTYTAGSGLILNGTTFDAITATTSITGITRLDDSITDNISNRAATPNAVYDFVTSASGGLQSQINAKDNYQYWSVGVTGSTDNILSTQTVTFTGAGLNNILYDSTNNIITISGFNPTGNYIWNLIGGTGIATGITSGTNVIFTGLGLASVSRSGNIIRISGATVNYTWSLGVGAETTTAISSGISVTFTGVSGITTRRSSNQIIIAGSGLSTSGYVNTVSGNLQNQITSLSNTGWYVGVTGISDLITSGQTVTFTGAGINSLIYNPSTNILTISGTATDLSNYATIPYVTGVSGSLQTQINSKDNYQYWTIGVTGVNDNILTTQTVTFTGAGLISLSYDQSSNTVTISGAGDGVGGGAGAGYTGWYLNVSGSNDLITSGQVVTFTGLGNTTITYDQSTNTVSVSGSSAGGSIDGAGSSGQVTYWSDSNSITGSANLTYTEEQYTLLEIQAGNNQTGVVVNIIDYSGDALFSITDTDDTLLRINAANAQTGNLLEITNTGGTIISYADKYGLLHGTPRVMTFGSDGGGSVLTTGIKTYSIKSPFNGTITGWEIAGSSTGTITFDIWKNTSGTAPVSSNSIVGSNPPKSTGNQFVSSTGLAGWDTDFNIGDIFAMVITAVTGYSQIILGIKYIEG